jgi:superfamily I DNA and/or RNA helicase
MKGAVDVLLVDEAGQISLANVLAAAQASRGLILLGDPQQLDQPTKGVHPPGADVSVLGHMLGDRATIDDDAGIFLHQTWRMHPDVCAYVSEVFYETKLGSRTNLGAQKINAAGLFGGTGLRLVEIEHSGNTNESPEEAAHIGNMVTALLSSGATWTDADGAVAPILAKHVLILTPYNAQVAALRKRVPDGVHTAADGARECASSVCGDGYEGGRGARFVLTAKRPTKLSPGDPGRARGERLEECGVGSRVIESSR